MVDSFFEEFQKFIDNRTCKINRDRVLKNFEYIKLINKSTILHKEIISLLPDSHKKQIDEYESTLNLIRAVSDSIMYENGFREGLKFRLELFE